MQDSDNSLSQLVKTLLLKDNGEPFIVESTCFGATLKLCDKLDSIKTGHNEDSNKYLYKAIIDERKMGRCSFLQKIPFADFTNDEEMELYDKAVWALSENLTDLLVIDELKDDPILDNGASNQYPRLKYLSFFINGDITDLSKVVSCVQDCNSLEILHMTQFNFTTPVLYPEGDASLAKNVKQINWSGLISGDKMFKFLVKAFNSNNEYKLEKLDIEFEKADSVLKQLPPEDFVVINAATCVNFLQYLMSHFASCSPSTTLIFDFSQPAHVAYFFES